MAETEINVREYLAYNELRTIIDECAKVKDPLERKFFKDMYLVRFATDIELEDEINSAQYDAFVEGGVIDAVYNNVKNIYLIDECLAKLESTEASMNRIAYLIGDFLDSVGGNINGLIDSLPKSSKGWNSMIKKLKEATDYANDKRPDADDGGTK
jgi:hypothetical protein